MKDYDPSADGQDDDTIFHFQIPHPYQNKLSTL